MDLLSFPAMGMRSNSFTLVFLCPTSFSPLVRGYCTVYSLDGRGAEFDDLLPFSLSILVNESNSRPIRDLFGTFLFGWVSWLVVLPMRKNTNSYFIGRIRFKKVKVPFSYSPNLLSPFSKLKYILVSKTLFFPDVKVTFFFQGARPFLRYDTCPARLLLSIAIK